MTEKVTPRELKTWFAKHSTHYDTVELNLRDTWREFMLADKNRQREMLLGSYKFAAISVQTPVNIHEEAWTALMGGAEPSDALSKVNYWRNKMQYMRETETKIEEIDRVIRYLENNQLQKAQQIIVDEFKGVSLKKSAFTLAMLGFTDMFCIDTNVRQASGITYDYTGKLVDRYNEIVDRIIDKYNTVERNPFLIQWGLFDAMRGTPATHTTFFKHI